MAGITLSAGVRDSLLSLQTTTQLINRTQGRLSTGLAVSSAIDDPIKFFQAKTLADRGTDFDEKTSCVDRGISSVTAAVDGTEAIEAIVARMKNLAVSAKSATASIIAGPVSRFNDLRTRIANLLALKTRQQLGIQALAFAGQAEQGVLALSRRHNRGKEGFWPSFSCGVGTM